MSMYVRPTVAVVLLGAGCAPAAVETARVIERPSIVAETYETPPLSVAAAEESSVDEFDVDVGRFDGGKMWTFDNPPSGWFREAYNLEADSAWFARARLGALRFGSNCSASFVSATALIMTNHHCARESIAEVSREEEDLLENGFYAASQEDERKVADLYVEQLLGVEDVTSRVHGASRVVRGDNERVQARRNKASEIERELTRAVAMQDSSLRVEVVELYSGGRYAAYTFRRFEDVRLVMAPEKRLGYFGGDPDNFTFPRYALDVSFFRAYDEAGVPAVTSDYYRWKEDGVAVGDPVFVVGNPGSTSRLGTVAQLRFEREYVLPPQIEALKRRAEILRPFVGVEMDLADGVENVFFSVSNSLKALTGQLEGLQDDTLIARRSAGESELREALFKSDSLSARYGTLFRNLEELQLSKRAEAQRTAAFAFFGTEAGSHVLMRALYGYYYANLQRRGFMDEEELEEIRKEALAIDDLPEEVEVSLVALRLEELREALGDQDPTFRGITEELPVDTVAVRLIATTALKDSAGFAGILDAGFLSGEDAVVPLINGLAPLYFAAQQQTQSLNNRQALLNGQLAQARFAIYGESAPPDASFSLRIADGIVTGYPYNDTFAPAHTTFYGLYDHYYAYRGISLEWDLPERWLTPPADFDLSTPLNLVSTNDITGGNSGSPLLSRDLEIVGLIFDGNIESLPNVYLYSDRTARAVSVDARGIVAALKHIYKADRILTEILGSSD